MKSGLFHKKGQSSETNIDFADVVGYARSEFRDGRSEREVLDLLVKTGQEPDAIRGVVHELYYECLGVAFIDRFLELMVKVVGVPIALFVFIRIETTWWAGLILLVVLTVYVILVSALFRKYWEDRYRRRLRNQG